MESIAMNQSSPVPSDRNSLVGQLLEMLRKKTGQSGEHWSANTTLQDAGVDSFDVVEYIFEIEDAFNVEIQFNANKDKLETVGDLASIIVQQMSVKAGV